MMSIDYRGPELDAVAEVRLENLDLLNGKLGNINLDYVHKMNKRERKRFMGWVEDAEELMDALKFTGIMEDCDYDNYVCGLMIRTKELCRAVRKAIQEYWG